MKETRTVLDSPAVYRINITETKSGDADVSVIVGRRPDQAALAGVLSVL